MRISHKLPVALIMSAAFVALIVTPAFAETGTLSAWWHLSSGSRPSNIQPGRAEDEIERLTVNAEAGTYRFHVRGGGKIEGGVVTFKVGATPAEVQIGLEREVYLPGTTEYFGYGAGNVEVTSPCTALPNPACTKALNPYEVYEIRFVGELAHRSLGVLEREPSPGSEPLVGGSATVTIGQVTEGRAAGVIVATLTNVGDANVSGEHTPIKIVDTLPAGLEATSAIGATPIENAAARHPLPCEVERSDTRVVSCTVAGSASEIYESDGLGLAPDRTIEVRIPVEVQRGAAPDGGDNEVSVSGGGKHGVPSRR